MSALAVVEKEVMTKEDYLKQWVSKALYYSRKERGTKLKPKPGEIYTADLGQNVGSEINGIRPVVIVTSTTYNMNAGVVTVVPCSLKEFAQKGQVRISEEILHEGKLQGVLKVEMIKTISKGRIGNYVGRLNEKGITLLGKHLEEFLYPLKKLKFNR